MTVKDIERVTGLGKSTLYRWRDGNWSRDPRGSEVQAFCAGLDIPLSVAHAALGWTGDERQPEPAPLADPDLSALARRLMDPRISDEERRHIRRTVRWLAGQPEESGGAASRAG